MHQTYQARTEQFKEQLTKLASKTTTLAWLRIIAFLALLAFAILFLSTEGNTYWFIATIVSVTLFALLVKRYVAVRTQRQFYQHLVNINEAEQKAVAYQHHHFPTGENFKEAQHPFIHDLDIFGKGSIFQYVDRTSTWQGKEKLANWLKQPTLDKEELLARQAAVKELAEKLEDRQHFQATGMMITETAEDEAEIAQWLQQEAIISNKKWLLPFMIVMPAIVIALGLSALFTLLPARFFWLAIFVQAVVYIPFIKPINTFYQQIGKRVALLRKYAGLIALVEKADFKSELLQSLQKSIVQPKSATEAITKLTKLMELFNQRQNAIMGLILNLLAVWDLQIVYRIEQWVVQHKRAFPEWIAAIATIDALHSLGNFYYNQPSYTFPTPSDQDFTLEAKGLGHPLIPIDSLVTSDFEITGTGKFYLITGSNMAGKSTFLRSVGVNLVLAMAGAPVCAQQMTFTPIPLFTSMRTDDSLQDHESYFYAELKRLKQIVDRLQAGEKVFIILDEILKGTNSNDKQAGSKAFIEQLIQLKGVGLLATHDLVLAQMEETYPEQVQNYCFEMSIDDNQLHFTYRLQRGICSSFNATFLMKKMGIVAS